jgi:hypothetical protein
MSEKNLWSVLRKRMVPDYWSEATRHEDAYQLGIADVSFVTQPSFSDVKGEHGWMELKWRAGWPSRANTAVTFPHYTDDQRFWLMRKGDKGGMTFLFAQIGDNYLLFDHVEAQRVGLLNTADTFEAACFVCNRHLDAEKLYLAILEHG